jgi:quercetin dioxygenase-like cupin family protein
MGAEPCSRYYPQLLVAGQAPNRLREPHEGQVLGLGFTRVRLVLTGADTGGAFTLSEQPLEPRALAGPLHRHAHEDGFIYVVSGHIGAHVDGQVVGCDPGSTVLVPRGAIHTFWNPTDVPAKVLELFTPAGLEGWFLELAEIVRSEPVSLTDIVESGRRFGTELDLDSVVPLLTSFDLRLPGI